MQKQTKKLYIHRHTGWDEYKTCDWRMSQVSKMSISCDVYFSARSKLEKLISRSGGARHLSLSDQGTLIECCTWVWSGPSIWVGSGRVRLSGVSLVLWCVGSDRNFRSLCQWRTSINRTIARSRIRSFLQILLSFFLNFRTSSGTVLDRLPSLHVSSFSRQRRPINDMSLVR